MNQVSDPQDKRTILVVDDDDSIRLLYRRYLQRLGFDVVEASNGVEGLARLKETPCELVITDIFMPEKEGLETIREIRELYGADIAIIAISGGGVMNAEVLLKMAGRIGANAVFMKPVDLGELSETITKLMESA